MADWFDQFDDAPSQAPAEATRAGLGARAAAGGGDPYSVARLLNSMIRPVAGALGGAAGFATGGVPGSMVVAGGAGAGGEALAQWLASQTGIERGDPSMAERIGRVGMAGLAEAIPGEGGGRGLRAGADDFSDNLYRAALKPAAGRELEANARASARAGRRVSLDESSLARQGRRERIPIGKGIGGRGSDILAARIKGYSDRLDALLASSPQKSKATDLTGRVHELRAEIMQEADPVPVLRALDKKINNFVGSRRVPGSRKLQEFSAEQVNELKRVWQNEALPYYRAKAAGEVVPARTALNARFAGNVARGARERLERIPGVAEQNAGMSSLMPLADAVESAELRTLPLLHFWNSPNFQSRASLLMDAGQPVIGQVPRAGYWGIEELLKYANENNNR